MCVVSMVGDHFGQKWSEPAYTQIFNNLDTITRYEFDALKREVEEMKKLLERAVEYDRKNNEPECQIEEKMQTLKKVAELLGVDLSNLV